MKILKVLLVVGFAFFSFLAQGQKGWELGGWLGISNYFGDLNSSFNVTDPGPAGGLLVRRNFNNRVSWKAGFNYGFVYADDANSNNNFEKNRNLSFRSNIFDLTAAMEFNFFPYTHGSTDEYSTPYFLGGINIFRFDPQAELNGTYVGLQQLGTEGQARGQEYSRINFGIVVGAGYKIDINHLWSINVELTVRKLFTDYVDDVSTVYPNKASLLSLRGQQAVDLSDRSLIPGIGEQNRQRGDSSDTDSYSFFGISIMRYFGRLECPEISKIR